MPVLLIHDRSRVPFHVPFQLRQVTGGPTKQ